MQTHPISSPADFPAVLYSAQRAGYVERQLRGDPSQRGGVFNPNVMSALSNSVPDTDDDLSLVLGMARGDESAATALYDRHGAVMYGLALRLVREPADAEEVVLDTFSQAWREAARFDVTRGSVLGWLTTILRSRALDLIRARGRRVRMIDDAGVRSTEPAGMGQGETAPDRVVDEAERVVAVSAALMALPEAQRRAIELAFFEGLTHQEVAARLHEPLGTIKTRIRLGMLKLRDMLVPHAPETLS